MLTTVINNTYQAYRNAASWYWSAPTQSRLVDLVTEVREVIATIGLVLSHCYEDCVELLATWLSDYDLEEVVVITEPCYHDVSWFDVRIGVESDLRIAIVTLSFWLDDIRDSIADCRYHMTSVITTMLAIIRL